MYSVGIRWGERRVGIGGIGQWRKTRCKKKNEEREKRERRREDRGRWGRGAGRSRIFPPKKKKMLPKCVSGHLEPDTLVFLARQEPNKCKSLFICLSVRLLQVCLKLSL